MILTRLKFLLNQQGNPHVLLALRELYRPVRRPLQFNGDLVKIQLTPESNAFTVPAGDVEFEKMAARTSIFFKNVNFVDHNLNSRMKSNVYIKSITFKCA